MKVDVPSEEFSAVAGPLLERVAGQLAGELVKASAALALERANGCLDKEGAAAYLGQKVRTIENWMRRVEDGGRGLPHSKIGETVLFKRSRIDAWLLTLERNTPPVLRAMEEAA